MKRTLQFFLLLAVTGVTTMLPGTWAQQTVTEEVTILPLPVPTNVIGTYVRGASNDGKRLVFESINDYNGKNIDSNTEIWVYEVETRSIIQITDTADLKDPADSTKIALKVNSYNPVISGDGTRIVFTSNAALGGTTNADGNYEIYAADLPRGATAATIKRITDTEKNNNDETVKEILTNYAPTVSDDGQTIAFVSTRNLFKPIVNGPATFAALKEGANNTDPDGNAEIFLYQEATRQYTQVTITRDVDATVNFVVRGFNSSPNLSGNGKVLAFLSAFNFPGAAANKNTDFNAEIFIYKIGDPANAMRQVTETNEKSAVPINGAENLLAAATEPLSFDGSKLVFESSGNFVAKNADKTREVYLADLSTTPTTFKQLTDQTTANFLTSDYNFYPSINSAGTYVVISSVLNLTPATTSGIKVDNADGSREIFRYDVAGAKFKQLTFAPLSDLVLDQRDNRSAPFINDAGDLASFSFDSRSLLPTGPVIADVFQAVIRPVASKNSTEAKIANAASFDNTQVARGSLAAIFGTQLSNATVSAPSGNLPFELAGVTVTVGGIGARLIYLSPGQINFVMPPNVATGDGIDFTINNNGIQSAGKVRVVDFAPGVFTVSGDGKGPAAAQCGQVAPDGLSFPLTPPPCAVGNESQFHTLVIYLTGIRNASSAVQVKIGDVTLTPSYAGVQPDFLGLDQINVGLSKDLAAKSDLDITVTVTGATALESNKTKVSFLPFEEAVSIVNAASFEAANVARGSLAIAQGKALANAAATAPGPDLPFTLGGVTATVAGLPARLSSVSETAVTFVVPQEAKLADLVEVVINNNGTKSRGRVKVLDASAGIFTTTNDGNGRATAKCGKPNADGSVTYTDPPCAVGTEASPNLLRIFGTGWRNAEKVIVKIGDSDITPTFAGAQPGLFGNDIIDLKLIPALAGKADVDIVITTTVGTFSKVTKSGVKISFSQ